MRRLLPALVVLCACGDADEPENTVTVGDELAAEVVLPLRVAGVDVGPFVEEIRGGCTSGPDACDVRGDCVAAAVDCGPEDERLRVTARWSSSDDVDLAIVEPRGDTLSFLRPTGLSGGRMILDPGRSCVPDRPAPPEIATWTGREAAVGDYTVVLTHFGSCMSGLGTTDVDVTLSAGGRHVATYRVSLAPTERSEALVLHTE